MGRRRITVNKPRPIINAVRSVVRAISRQPIVKKLTNTVRSVTRAIGRKPAVRKLATNMRRTARKFTNMRRTFRRPFFRRRIRRRRPTFIRRENFQRINPSIYNTPNPETIGKNFKIVQTNINNLSSIINSILSNTINNIQFTHVNFNNSNTSIVFNTARSCEEYILYTLDKQVNLLFIDLNKIRDVVSMGVISSSYNPIKMLFNQNFNRIDNNLKQYINRQTPSQSAPAPAPVVITAAPAPPIPTYKAPVTSVRSTYNANMITQKDYYNFGRTVEGFNNYISPSYINNMPIIEGLNDVNVNSISEIAKKEKELIRQLNDFNQKYETYIQCNDPTNKNRSNLVCTGNDAPTSGKLITQMNTINGLIFNINDNVGFVKDNNKYTLNDYKRNYYKIVNRHRNVKRLRNELDVKVQRLYNPEQSIISDYGYNFDSTIYSGILISALATSVLYYMFKEL